VKRIDTEDSETQNDPAKLAEIINIFRPLYLPKKVLESLAANDEEATAIAAATPGAVTLMVLQFAMRDCIALLPHRALELEPDAVVPPELEDDEEDEEETDDEESADEADEEDGDSDDDE
jgi:hypothetical protein